MRAQNNVSLHTALCLYICILNKLCKYIASGNNRALSTALHATLQAHITTCSNVCTLYAAFHRDTFACLDDNTGLYISMNHNITVKFHDRIVGKVTITKNLIHLYDRKLTISVILYLSRFGRIIFIRILFIADAFAG